MAWHRAAIFAALSFLALGATPLAAQDVTLTSRDGSVEINGTLLGFDGEFYRVDTQYGELTVDGSGVGCDGPGCPNLSDFVAELAFSGSGAMAEVLLPALVEGFALRNGLLTRRETLDDRNFAYVLSEAQSRADVAHFSFRIGTTDEGFADLLANEADVVMALREIRPDERSRAAEAGMGDMTSDSRSRVLALDALVPVVAPGNPVRALSLPQLVQVVTGQIDNWSALGGPDAPIALHLPGAGSGLGQAVEDRLLASVGAAAATGAIRHDQSANLGRAVSTDPFAFGLASFAETGTARILDLTGPCGFDLRATRRSIKTEDYPLTAPLFLYLPARRLPAIAREFLIYAASPAAQLVIRRAGFVDQAPEHVPVAAQGDRLANAIGAAGDEVPLTELQRLVALQAPTARLTTSFRFEAGSTRPDAQSRANIERLARALEAGAYDARRLVFVGFSDGEGPAAGNLEIAQARATAVLAAVRGAAQTAALDRVRLEAAAFGEALPMACDDSDWGRQVNRRVEVWIE